MAEIPVRPGYQARFCPVCKRSTGTHREPINDERREMVVYHQHNDKLRQPCRMNGKRAAIRAVAFTATDTGAPVREFVKTARSA